MCGIDPVTRLWHLVDRRRTPASISTSRCFEGSICKCAVNCANTYILRKNIINILGELRVKMGYWPGHASPSGGACLGQPLSRLGYLDEVTYLLCALDVGRELSRLHSLNGAEANSMFSLGRYSNELIVLYVLSTVLNKLYWFMCE